MKRVCLNIGDIAVSQEPAILETILGSCVAVCLWDARRKVGGLNHFLVPAGRGTPERSTLYGVTSVRLLVESMIANGADRHGLQARIFGGGTILKSLEDIFTIGTANVRIAHEILKEYGIPVVSDFVGAECGIRVSFQTDTGAVSVTCFDQESGRRYQDYYRQTTEHHHELEFRSIHATTFFYGTQQYHYLQTMVLPELATRATEVRAWSAGCATGEDAYSLAISLTGGAQIWYDTPDTPPSPVCRSVKILATDTSRKALVTALAGIYGIEQLPAEMPGRWRSAFFLKGHGPWQGHIRVKPYLHQMVRFRHLSLRNPFYPFKRPFDIIFCRDAMRAFDDDAKQRALLQLHQHLAPAGYLFLGKTDRIPDSKLFEQTHDTVYRRT